MSCKFPLQELNYFVRENCKAVGTPTNYIGCKLDQILILKSELLQLKLELYKVGTVKNFKLEQCKIKLC